jgi:hypothetical protein
MKTDAHLSFEYTSRETETVSFPRNQNECFEMEHTITALETENDLARDLYVI